MKAISLETNRRNRPMAIARQITLQETQGLKEVLLKMLVIIAGAALVAYMIALQVRVHTLEAENSKLFAESMTYDSALSQTEAEYNSTIDKLESNIKSSNNVIETLNSEVSTLVADNKSLAKQYDGLSKKYNVLASREELYDKYKYVVTYAGKRTDVTYSQIKLGEKLMEENGYDPHILFSTLMVESRGDEDARNRTSTARGFGQFLRGTGKGVYEDLLGHGDGTYDHSMALNGTTNIKMMAAYLSKLLDRRDGNLFLAMKSYSGRNNSGTYRYMSWMNDFSSTVGVNIYNLSD